MHVVFVGNLKMSLFIFMEEGPMNAKAPSTSLRVAMQPGSQTVQSVFHWLLLCPFSQLASSTLRPTLLDCRKDKWEKICPKALYSACHLVSAQPNSS